MEKEKLNDMCQAWREMCQINRRFDALKSVAEFFGLADHTATVRAKYGRVGYMRGDVFADLLEAEKSMMADIRGTYGNDTCNLVINSLNKFW